MEWRRLLIGCAIGSLIAIAVHLAFWDSVFVPALQGKWTPKQKFFDGFSAYKPELVLFSSVLVALVGACCYCHLALSARLVVWNCKFHSGGCRCGCRSITTASGQDRIRNS